MMEFVNKHYRKMGVPKNVSITINIPIPAETQAEYIDFQESFTEKISSIKYKKRSKSESLEQKQYVCSSTMDDKQEEVNNSQYRGTKKHLFEINNSEDLGTYSTFISGLNARESESNTFKNEHTEKYRENQNMSSSLVVANNSQHEIELQGFASEQETFRKHKKKKKKCHGIQTTTGNETFSSIDGNEEQKVEQQICTNEDTRNKNKKLKKRKRFNGSAEISDVIEESESVNSGNGYNDIQMQNDTYNEATRKKLKKTSRKSDEKNKSIDGENNSGNLQNQTGISETVGSKEIENNENDKDVKIETYNSSETIESVSDLNIENSNINQKISRKSKKKKQKKLNESGEDKKDCPLKNVALSNCDINDIDAGYEPQICKEVDLISPSSDISNQISVGDKPSSSDNGTLTLLNSDTCNQNIEIPVVEKISNSVKRNNHNNEIRVVEKSSNSDDDHFMLLKGDIRDTIEQLKQISRVHKSLINENVSLMLSHSDLTNVDPKTIEPISNNNENGQEDENYEINHSHLQYQQNESQNGIVTSKARKGKNLNTKNMHEIKVIDSNAGIKERTSESLNSVEFNLPSKSIDKTRDISKKRKKKIKKLTDDETVELPKSKKNTYKSDSSDEENLDEVMDYLKTYIQTVQKENPINTNNNAKKPIIQRKKLDDYDTTDSGNSSDSSVENYAMHLNMSRQDTKNELKIQTKDCSKRKKYSFEGVNCVKDDMISCNLNEDELNDNNSSRCDSMQNTEPVNCEIGNCNNISLKSYDSSVKTAKNSTKREKRKNCNDFRKDVNDFISKEIISTNNSVRKVSSNCSFSENAKDSKSKKKQFTETSDSDEEINDLKSINSDNNSSKYGSQRDTKNTKPTTSQMGENLRIEEIVADNFGKNAKKSKLKEIVSIGTGGSEKEVNGLDSLCDNKSPSYNGSQSTEYPIHSEDEDKDCKNLSFKKNKKSERHNRKNRKTKSKEIISTDTNKNEASNDLDGLEDYLKTYLQTTPITTKKSLVSGKKPLVSGKKPLVSGKKLDNDYDSMESQNSNDSSVEEYARQLNTSYQYQSEKELFNAKDNVIDNETNNTCNDSHNSNENKNRHSGEVVINGLEVLSIDNSFLQNTNNTDTISYEIKDKDSSFKSNDKRKCDAKVKNAKISKSKKIVSTTSYGKKKLKKENICHTTNIENNFKSKEFVSTDTSDSEEEVNSLNPACSNNKSLGYGSLQCTKNMKLDDSSMENDKNFERSKSNKLHNDMVNVNNSRSKELSSTASSENDTCAKSNKKLKETKITDGTQKTIVSYFDKILTESTSKPKNTECRKPVPNDVKNAINSRSEEIVFANTTLKKAFSKSQKKKLVHSHRSRNYNEQLEKIENLEENDCDISKSVNNFKSKDYISTDTSDSDEEVNGLNSKQNDCKSTYGRLQCTEKAKTVTSLMGKVGSHSKHSECNETSKLSNNQKNVNDCKSKDSSNESDTSDVSGMKELIASGQNSKSASIYTSDSEASDGFYHQNNKLHKKHLYKGATGEHSQKNIPNYSDEILTARYLHKLSSSSKSKTREHKSDDGSNNSEDDIRTKMMDIISHANEQLYSVMEENEQLTYLTINIDFDVPLSHLIETRICSCPTKQQLEFFDHINLKMKSGPFTKAEDSIIKANFKHFCKSHCLPHDPVPFLNFKYGNITILKKDEKMNFARYLGKGLANRKLYRIYQRFKVLFSTIKKGRFTREEDAVILQYMEKFKDMSNQFSSIGKIINRSRVAIQKRYKTLRIEFHKMPARPTLEFVTTLMAVTKCNKVKTLRDREVTDKEWAKLSRKLNIPIENLRLSWIGSIYTKLFHKGPINANEILGQLLDRLDKAKADDYRKLNWEKLAKPFKYVTRVFLYRMFKRARNKWVPEELHANLRECVCILKELHKGNKVLMKNIRRFKMK